MSSALALTLVLFWAGLFLLLWLFAALRTVRRLIRFAERAWEVVDSALTRRTESLPHLLSTAASANDARTSAILTRLRTFRQNATMAEDRTARLEAEQAISRELLMLLDETAARRWDPHGEWTEREHQIAEGREHYNEAARTLNGSRRSFPVGLVARALVPGDLPLFL